MYTPHVHRDAIHAWADGWPIKWAPQRDNIEVLLWHRSTQVPTQLSWYANYSYEKDTLADALPVGHAHRHAAMVKAWADGYPVQMRHSDDEGWEDLPLAGDVSAKGSSAPTFNEANQYRLLPGVTTHQPRHNMAHIKAFADGMLVEITYPDGHPQAGSSWWGADRVENLVLPGRQVRMARIQPVHPEPHYHATVIRAWADGHSVEYYSEYYGMWRDVEIPTFGKSTQYRVKGQTAAAAPRDANPIINYIRDTNPHAPNGRHRVGYGRVFKSSAMRSLRDKLNSKVNHRFGTDFYSESSSITRSRKAYMTEVSDLILAHLRQPNNIQIIGELYARAERLEADWLYYRARGSLTDRLAAKFEPLAQYREASDKFNDLAGWKQVWWVTEGKLPAMPGHLLHVSTDDPKMVAYFPDVKHLGEGRKPVKTTPGRYLAKFYPWVEESVRKELAEVHVAEHSPIQVKIARSESEVIRAINEGPSESCMSGKFHSGRDWWNGHVHPAAVYGYPDDDPSIKPDTEVLYFESRGEIKARVICNAVTKLCARIYGDVRKMLPAIQEMGYRLADKALVDAKIRRIENRDGDGWIMPYVDRGTGSGGGYLYVEEDPDDDDFWVLSAEEGSSTYEGYENKGVMGGERNNETECAHCGEYYDEDEMTHVDGYGHVCSHCLEEDFVEARGRYGWEWSHRDHVIRCESDDEYYLESATDYYEIYQCAETGDWFKSDDLVSTDRGDLHTDYATSLDEEYNGYEWAHNDDVVETHDGRTIHKQAAVTDFYDDEVYHVGDDEPLSLPMPNGPGRRMHFTSENFIENHEDFNVSGNTLYWEVTAERGSMKLSEYLLTSEHIQRRMLRNTDGVSLDDDFVNALNELRDQLIDEKEGTIDLMQEAA